MLDWMKYSVGSGGEKGEEVFPRLKKVKCQFGAVGESNFGIKMKRNQTHVDGIWLLTNFLRIPWRI